jgi:glutaredoxin
MDTCPKCRYVRQSTDVAPEWQCPKCGVAYNKAAAADPVFTTDLQRRVSRSQPPVWGKVAMALFLVVGLYLCFAPPWAHREHPHRAAAADPNAPQPEVILYATSWCPYCAKARDFFHSNGIRYTEYDIERDAAAFQAYRKVHGNGIPVVVVGDDVVHGYDPEAMTELLQPWMR